MGEIHAVEATVAAPGHERAETGARVGRNLPNGSHRCLHAFSSDPADRRSGAGFAGRLSQLLTEMSKCNRPYLSQMRPAATTGPAGGIGSSDLAVLRYGIFV